MLTQLSFSDPGLCKLMLCPGRSQDPISNYRPLVITDLGLSCPGLEQVLQNAVMDLVDVSPHAAQTTAENKPGEQLWWTDCWFSENST